MRKVRQVTPFHKLWTERFWDSGRLNSQKVNYLHAELTEHCGDQTWTRMVINNWQGSTFESMVDVTNCATWLAEAGDPQVFLTRRGITDYAWGVQIWCVKSDVQLLVHMMSAPVLHVRSYTQEQFAEHTLTMLNWKLMS